MPGSFIGELILGPILEFGAYFVGKIVVPLFTLGQIRCDRLGDEPRRSKKSGAPMHYRRGKQIYLTAEGTALAGLLFVLLAGGGFLIYYLQE